MPKRKFYAVAVGRETGIFSTWDQCLKQVNKYPGNKYQGFLVGQEAEAQAYLNSYDISFAPLPSLEPNEITKRPTL